MMEARIAIAIPIGFVQESQFSLVFLQRMGQSAAVRLSLLWTSEMGDGRVQGGSRNK